MNHSSRLLKRGTFLLIMLSLLIVGGCVGGVWIAAQPSADRFLVPGAFDVRVAEAGVGQRLITYRMANPQDGWLSSTARRLQDEGWEPPTALYVWGSTEQYANIYTRHIRVWRVDLWEQARLDGDSRSARITVRRWVEWR